VSRGVPSGKGPPPASSEEQTAPTGEVVCSTRSVQDPTAQVSNARSVHSWPQVSNALELCVARHADQQVSPEGEEQRTANSGSKGIACTVGEKGVESERVYRTCRSRQGQHTLPEGQAHTRRDPA